MAGLGPQVAAFFHRPILAAQVRAALTQEHLSVILQGDSFKQALQPLRCA